MHKPIDFASLAAALLDRADTLVERWLPGGSWRGREYVCADLGGGRGTSLSVNCNTGRWADFAHPDDKGGDLISLYAAVFNLDNVSAARDLMRELGWATDEPAQTSAHRAPAQSHSERPEPPPWEGEATTPAGAPAQADAGGKRKGDSPWRAVVPVPEHASTPRFVHFKLGESSKQWAYRRAGALLGYVCRFDHEDGSKDTLPMTWCVDESDGRGLQRWHWKQWCEPRPLYLPAGDLRGADVPVVVVEGEKCAQAGHALLGEVFDFVTWPGGSKVPLKADWSWLAGRKVYLWPDADSQHERLTPTERQEGVDPKSKPLLPAHKQPGQAAMNQLGTVLLAQQGCEVLMCRIPKPGAISDGWDVADAIESGWDAARVRGFIEAAQPYRPPEDEAAAKAAAQAQQNAGAGSEEGEANGWRAGLIKTGNGTIKPVRENAVLALNSIPEVVGLIAYNEFTNNIMKLRDTPWGSPAGQWDEVDELLMGEWLAREHWLPSMPRGTLEEAVRMVAFRNRFHPVRSYLESLAWDGEARLRHWLQTVCLEEDEHRDSLQRYLARVGTWFLQGMVARVMQPGVKFDYMLILEGKQGRRKSSVFKALAGDFFADTGLQMGDKDSYQQLQGRWLYEFAELDAMAKSEVTKVKAFIASAADYFRASFDKRARDYPRQIVFGGTTNEETYLTDPTGGRRFWPVQVTRELGCDIEWLLANRDQLFAEAMHRYRQGARMYPTIQEEEQLFQPEQESRAVENPIEQALREYLTNHVEGQLFSEITTTVALGKIGINLEKLGPGNYHIKQAGAALKRMGWDRQRASRSVAGERPWVYVRPKHQQPGQAQPEPALEADDPSPF